MSSTESSPILKSEEQINVTQTINLFVRELTVLDYAYLDPMRGVLGHSLDVDAELIGAIDDEGVIFDFSYAKKAVKQVIDSICDHRLVVPKHAVKELNEKQSRVLFSFGSQNILDYLCPEQGLCVLENSTVTIGAIQSYLEQKVMEAMPENVQCVRLTLREEKFSEEQAIYHYSHGLKQHYGNCQRLLHGHRNKIDIKINGKKDLKMESFIAKEWNDIHLAFPENIQNQNIKIGQRQHHLDQITIQYISSQGEFKVTLPGKDVYIMPYETTVENISRHLAEKVKSILKAEGNASKVQVWAYEGIRKGAASEL